MINRKTIASLEKRMQANGERFDTPFDRNYEGSPKVHVTYAGCLFFRAMDQRPRGACDSVTVPPTEPFVARSWVLSVQLFCLTTAAKQRILSMIIEGSLVSIVPKRRRR